MTGLEKYPPSMTVAQIAESQGVCIKTARKWCLQDGLKSFKVGNTRRVRKEVFISWIEERETIS